MRHFLYKLEANLGLSNPSHSPEETWASSAGNLMSKYLLKFIKYILLSSKDWTRVGNLSYRDVFVHSTSISRENILSIELVLKSHTPLQQRLTIKVPPVMWIFWAFTKKSNLDCWAWWSSMTDENIFVSVTHREILFWICISQVGLHFGIRRGEWNFL